MALLSEHDISTALPGLGWERDGEALVKVVKGQDFGAALTYVNAVGRTAEAADHHPDIDIRWNTVKLRLSTHSEGGITDKDLALARQIDLIEQPS